ncbi:Pyrimidine 5'-nucleotidase YjjG [Elizabethkingia miricola]|nr:Pyrimidine 5'-nucleotidase YjjG [Elizabethkingia miricola]
MSEFYNMKFRHIFFDLDNTLWDHRKNAYLTLKDLFNRKEINSLYGIDFEEFHHKYDEINERLWEQIRDGEIDKEYLRQHRFYDTFMFFGVDNTELAEHFEVNFLDEIVGYNELVDGTKEVLDYLKDKNYNIHIISNGFYDVTHRKIKGSGLTPYFETITSADDVGVRKPNPKIFEYALGKANAQKEESILIGDDWIADVKGSQGFGMDVIFFDALKEDKQEEKLKSVKHLLDIKSFL